MLVYPATFEKGSQYYVVMFPDIPAAMTQGETIEEAYEMASEVLGAVLEDYKEFPKPSSMDQIKLQYPNKDVALIGIDLNAYRRKYHSKTVRKNVTVPEWLSDLAIKENINFSQTLTEALKEKLGV
ncbi:type II toxin-antitoxin system HicB family antitoxin [Ignavigranum ruoffiae]|uniref:type II toxin-antitoxin system HicB family antitoxin n=1 Tax=Ignavigranum ruoffiae TaxID=89093 RepID=UPI0020459EFE|nr:type II toxin-antitoxin system HicB family antitoxin [Ignavigranum ruoffiae]UPQ85106.1 type II toxin-antitoxin system HicB family antitoxin [Ignavigranum ruoffiae]